MSGFSRTTVVVSAFRRTVNGKVCASENVVTWLTWLIVVLLVATFAALTGIKPAGTRPVAHTRLMGMARLALIVVVLILAFIAFRARAGG